MTQTIKFNRSEKDKMIGKEKLWDFNKQCIKDSIENIEKYCDDDFEVIIVRKPKEPERLNNN